MTTANTTGLPAAVIAAVRRALDEDIGSGDVTTDSIFGVETHMRGEIVARQAGVIAGLDVAQLALQMLDDAIVFNTLVPEGARVANRQTLAALSGRARPLLTGERTALNFLGRM